MMKKNRRIDRFPRNFEIILHEKIEVIQAKVLSWPIKLNLMNISE